MRMGSIRVDPAVWHLQRGPAANRVQPPEIIVATEEVIAPLADLFLLHAISRRHHWHTPQNHRGFKTSAQRFRLYASIDIVFLG
jgi:hypothetical protein